MHLYTHMYMRGTPEGLTGPDMEAAQQLVHLSGDEEESDSHGGGRKARPAGVAESTIKFGGHDQKAKVTTVEAKGGAADADDKEDGGGEDDDDRSNPRKRRFRSIAYIYKVTRPVRLFEIEAKRRKSH